MQFQDGTHGPKCIDIDMKDSSGGGFTCPWIYNTYKCETGFFCNRTVPQLPECDQSSVPGAGDYPTNDKCAEYCQKPDPLKDLYKCNTTSYACNICKDKVQLSLSLSSLLSLFVSP